MYYNSKGEAIVYVNRSARGNILNIYMAGETFPNPDYRITHNTESSHRWDMYVFEYVTSGRGFIDDGSRIHPVVPGDFYFLNKMKRHIYYSDPRDPFRKKFIVFSGVLADRLISAYRLGENLLIKHADLDPMFSEILGLLLPCENNAGRRQIDRIAIILHEIIQKVAGENADPAAGGAKPPLPEQIKFYIDNNVYSMASLDELSSYFFISKTHIINTFRKKYGKTPIKYLREKNLKPRRICCVRPASESRKLRVCSIMPTIKRLSRRLWPSTAYPRENTAFGRTEKKGAGIH